MHSSSFRVVVRFGKALIAISFGVVFFAFNGVPANAAGLLDFETDPSGNVPVNGASLTSPYSIPNGTVRFYFDTNADNAYTAGVDQLPIFQHIGGAGSAGGFTSTYNGNFNTARPGYTGELGTWFLRQPGTTDNVPGPFIAQYDTTTNIRELSGEIWDIDGASNGTEQWRVDVLNGSNTVLSSELSPLGTTVTAESLDSLPWVFAFHNLPDGVSKLRLTFVGTKPSGIGLAFNNFSPTVAVPEPTGLGFALAGLMLVSRRSHGHLSGNRE